MLLHSNFIEICFENDMQTIYYRAIYQDNKFETTMFEYYFCGTTIIIDDIKNLTDKDVVNIFNDKREEVCYIKNKELLQAYDNLTSRLTSNKKNHIFYWKDKFYKLEHTKKGRIFSNVNCKIKGVTERVKKALQNEKNGFLFELFIYNIPYTKTISEFFYQENDTIYLLQNNIYDFLVKNQFSEKEFVQKSKLVYEQGFIGIININGNFFVSRIDNFLAKKNLLNCKMKINKIKDSNLEKYFGEKTFYYYQKKSEIYYLYSPIINYWRTKHVVLDTKNILAYNDLIWQYIEFNKKKMLYVIDFKNEKEYYYELKKNDHLSENQILLNVNFESDDIYSEIYSILRKKIEENKEKIELETEDFEILFSFV